ncbi:MAG: RNA polymerase sigma factor [Clostridia bacterium]
MTEQTFCDNARSCRKLLYHIAYTILRDNRECEDAVQEALLRAWEKRNSLRDETAFRFWLSRILTNTCNDLARKKRRIASLELEREPAVSFEDGMENSVLYDSIGKLPQELRLPIILHYLEGFSTKEIATLIRRPEGTVRNRLFRARKVLRDLLGEELEI